jgi:hypothetical protein
MPAACRNSKLTMLLQDSLGGDAKALMVANLAPSPAHAQETLSSLAFAAKASPRPSAQSHHLATCTAPSAELLMLQHVAWSRLKATFLAVHSVQIACKVPE